MTVFLLTKIDHPELLGAPPTPETEHLASSQVFLLEEILLAHGAQWMERVPQGVLSAFEGGTPAQAALAIQTQFRERSWGSFGKAKIRAILHAGEADRMGEAYVGPEMSHALKLLDAAWGGQILLTPPAVHFVPLPPGGRIQDLGTHFLKDLSEPQNVFSLRHPDLPPDGETPPLKSLNAYSHNFSPQGSPFFGRKEEIAEISQMLSDPSGKLITLTGPGGFGKTRLALQSAAEVIESFEDGIYLVSLAPLLSDQLLIGSIASAIHFSFYGPADPKTQLLNHLREKQILIVLDNFEHIIEGARLVKEILDGSLRAKLLVTTREALRVPGEKVLAVGGLRYPENDQAAGFEAASAVQLFVKSAKRIRPDFQVNPGEKSAILKICRLLEGMPLGLELAATWVGGLSLPEIAEMIGTNQDFLSTSMPHLPPRHRSLRAVFEYSWILLTEPQKKALKAISVFKKGFRQQAAREVADATPDLLSFLENKSLLRKEPGGRFEIHQLLRYYAKEKLFDDPAEKEEVFDIHCAYFAQTLRKKEKDLLGPSQKRVLEELVEEMENIRDGWKRAVEKTREKEMDDYLDGLFSIYETKGWFQEGRDAFQKAAEALREKLEATPEAPRKPAVLLGKALSRWASFENRLGRPQTAQKLFEESLECFGAVSARKQSGFALSGLGTVAEIMGDYQKAKVFYEKSFTVYLRARNRPGIVLTLNHLGHMASRMRNFKQAHSLIRRSLGYSKADGDQRAMAYSYNLLGDLSYDSGRYQEARDFYHQGLSAYIESQDKDGTAWSFINLGRAADAIGNYSGAQQMYQEGLKLTGELGDKRGTAWCHDLLGSVHWAEGDYPQARSHYEQGLALYHEVGDRRGEAEVMNWLGNLAVAEGEYSQAQKFYEQSYDLLEKEGWTGQYLGWHYYHLGTLHYFQGQYEPARELFEKSMKQFERIKDTLGAVVTLTHLGEVYCDLGLGPKALGCFRTAMKKALDSRLVPHLVDILVGLAKWYRVQGDHRNAFAFLALALRNPTCRRQTKDKIVRFASQLESEIPTQEVQDLVEWAKTSRIEEVAAEWLSAQGSTKKKKKLKKKSPAKKKR